MKHFCIAYLEPTNPVHMACVPTITKYDMAIVSVTTPMGECSTWLNEVRARNPKILLIGYVQVATEDHTPSVSGGVQRQAHPLAWLPDLRYEPNGLYANYSAAAWQDAFLQGCARTLQEYPLDGLFLDNCAVWAGHVRRPVDGPTQAEALQRTISTLRRQNPHTVLIGNTSDKWTDLNGELNENRPDDYPRELQSSYRHAWPEMKLAHVYSSDQAVVKIHHDRAKAFGAWFGASPSCQDVRWFDCFA